MTTKYKIEWETSEGLSESNASCQMRHFILKMDLLVDPYV